ncbi:glycosyltransferase [Segetibacter sp. 3557_3]|uniref:glycosyltransferase n=1 Tax=Segetibacter sp. 3557_3 TaxID=2547429 RepID=UPI0010585D69|nr:glycosyltransferase [Segetibacter sp. 3557_3]TDH28043.1 glycosyltransferase [Segetibacter sp. 3557_3]
MAEILDAILGKVNFPYKDYVLVLPGWYPTWLDPYPGDFNQRQVFAAGLHVPQLVLYIGKDTSGTLKSVEARVYQPKETVTEIIVVYPGSNGILEPVKSNYTFFRLLLQYSLSIRKRWGRPLLLHSYIVIRGGLAGWLLSVKWNLRLVLSEHWTIYDPEDPGYLPKRNPVFQSAVRLVFKRISRLLPVSEKLGIQAVKLNREVPYKVIPNVVDTRLFYRTKRDTAPSRHFRFIHVSTMTYQKNAIGIIKTFNRFSQHHDSCSLHMVGPYPAEVFEYASRLNAPGKILFSGPVTYSEVGAFIRQADALVLFSRYENLPCVVLESLCCGVPVISTGVGGIPEVINDTNGILIDNENEQQLERAFERMLNQHFDVNSELMAQRACALYSLESVGKQIKGVYEELLHRRL